MRKKPTPTDSAATETQRTTTITLGDTSYPLRYDFNKVVEVEPEAGCNLLRGLMNIQQLNALQLRGLFLAGIKAADPASKMTIAEAGALIRFDSIHAVTEALAQSILLSLPEGAVTPTSAA